MPVYFDARMAGHSGIGTQVHNVLRRLALRDDIDLTILGDPDIIANHVPAFAGRVISFRAPIYSISEQVSYPAVPDGAILHHPHYNAPISRMKRAVVVLHDLIHLQSSEFRIPVYRMYCRFMLGQLAKRAARIACVSQKTADDFIELFPEAGKRTSVIHNGVDNRLFRPASAAAQNAFRRKYALPASYLLTVGIGKKHKNVDFVIRALSILWESGELKVPLVLGGTGGTIPRNVMQEIYQRGAGPNIMVLPPVPESELPLMYASAGALIMPSLLEGFGFPVVEAMACGTPVLSSDASCLPEIGGKAPLYFNPRNEDELTNRVRRILNKKSIAGKLKKAGIARAKMFSWDTHVESLVRLYHSVHKEK